jgi:hypothetical protein
MGAADSKLVSSEVWFLSKFPFLVQHRRSPHAGNPRIWLLGFRDRTSCFGVGLRIDMLIQGLADVIETIKAGRSGAEVEPCIERLQTLHVVSGSEPA